MFQHNVLICYKWSLLPHHQACKILHGAAAKSAVLIDVYVTSVSSQSPFPAHSV